MGDLSSLLSRVEEANGPNYALERDIALAFSEPDVQVVVTPVTASLDAALSLCERVLPGWFETIERVGPNQWRAILSRREAGHDACYGKGRSRSLALLAALLRALISQEK